MPAWFSKVFNRNNDSGESADKAPPVTPPAYEEDAIEEEHEKPRRTVFAPVLADEAEQSAYSNEIQIKAQIQNGSDTCTFLVDRPLLPGLSFQCRGRDTACANAPLAGVLFDLSDKVRGVLIHDMTITVAGMPWDESEWEALAREAGPVIRAHLKGGKAVVLPEVIAQIPPAEEIRAKLQQVIDNEINPGIAAHSGVITLNRVVGNTAYITMGGGCQGCAASTITLRSGVEGAFRKAVPMLGAVLDETDHTAGTNPYFSELPAGMAQEL
ncbi:MAG: NifU family protein [Candidatus Hydrogenedentota bacterium]